MPPWFVLSGKSLYQPDVHQMHGLLWQRPILFFRGISTGDLPGRFPLVVPFFADAVVIVALSRFSLVLVSVLDDDCVLACMFLILMLFLCSCFSRCVSWCSRSLFFFRRQRNSHRRQLLDLSSLSSPTARPVGCRGMGCLFHP